MDEDCYVETSDIEELDSVYDNTLDQPSNNLRNPVTPRMQRTLHDDSQSPRKRRKLDSGQKFGVYPLEVGSASATPATIASEEAKGIKQSPYAKVQEQLSSNQKHQARQVAETPSFVQGTNISMSSSPAFAQNIYVEEANQDSQVTPQTPFKRGPTTLLASSLTSSNVSTSPKYAISLPSQPSSRNSPLPGSSEIKVPSTTVLAEPEESEDELAAFPLISNSPPNHEPSVESLYMDAFLPLCSPSPPPSPTRPIQSDSGIPDPHPATDTTDETNANQRYPLRRRQINQLRPYKWDAMIYKRTMRGNKHAMINIRQTHRTHTNHPEDRYEEEDPDEQDYVEEESGRAERERHRAGPDQETSGSPKRALPAFLDPLPDSDGENDLTKEIRRMEREKRRREKEERERERQWRRAHGEEHRKRPKPYPSPASPNEYAPHESTIAHIQTPSAPRARHTSRRSLSTSLPLERPSDADALREYFKLDLTLDDDDDDETVPKERAATTSDIEIHSQPEKGNEDENIDERPGDDSESDQSDLELQIFTEKQRRILFRMFPPALAREKMREAVQAFKKTQRARSSSVNPAQHITRLLPGQTRQRISTNPRDIKDIRGDSESEGEPTSPARVVEDGDIRDFFDHDVDVNSPPRSDHVHIEQEAVEMGPSWPRPSTPPRKDDVIIISDDEEILDSSEDEIDGEDIEAYLKEDAPGVSYESDQEGVGEPENVKVKEESLIDWMLSRTRIVDSKISKPKVPREKAPSSKKSKRYRDSSYGKFKPRLDIVTQGVKKRGRERQTLLNFPRAKKPSSQDPSKTGPVNTTSSTVQVDGAEQEKRKSWKEKRRERRERDKRRGVYSVASTNQFSITSGRVKKPIKFTIDIDDEDFYQLFRPQSQEVKQKDKGKAKADSPRSLAPTFRYDSSDDRATLRESDYQRRNSSIHRIKECSIELRIQLLQAGIKFSSASFVGRGWLYELVEILSSNHAPLRPDPTFLCGLSLDPSMTARDFSAIFVSICDGLLDLVANLPETDYDDKVKDWSNLSRSACRLISWLVSQSGQIERAVLANAIKESVLSVLEKLRSIGIPQHALSFDCLSLCWFCVESSSRVGYRISESESELNPLNASVNLLVYYLLEYGLLKPYRAVRKYTTLNDAPVSCYVAQMWICLIHVLPCCDGSPADPKKEHPVWREVLRYYRSRTSINTFEASENLWRTIFVLMAFSQFSSHGMTTSSTRLPPSWNLAGYAIKQVQLVTSTDRLQHFKEKTLDRRDAYISIVISRCYHLLDYWRWKMDNSFNTLNQLVDIFRGRNFVNLRHEEAEYPDFMLNHDWNLIFQLRSGSDTAFTSILKLLMRAIDSHALSSSEIRKMLALIIPISRFKTNRNVIPTISDLSPICNRLTATALAAVVEPGSADRRIAQVQRTIDFREADASTQVLVVRGVMLLGSLVVNHDISTQGIAMWLLLMVEEAVTEFKSLTSCRFNAPSKQRDHEVKVRNYILVISGLYAAGRVMMETFANKNRYPDPALSLAFRSLLEADCSKAVEEYDHKMYEMRRFFHSFLEARVKHIPLLDPLMSRGPNENRAQAEDPDSQDYGDFDFGINLDDLTTLAELEEHTNQFENIRVEEQKILQPVIFPSFWIAHRKIKQFCEATVDITIGGENAQLKDLDCWTHCLVGAMHILIQHGKLNDWSFCICEVSALWNQIRFNWLRNRVQVSIFSEILRHDPPFHTKNRNILLEIFFESFATFATTNEVSYWLRVTYLEASRDSLLKGTEDILKQAHMDNCNLDDIRISVLEVLFRKLDADLQDETKDIVHRRMCVELCFKLLSMIRSNTQDLACDQVVQNEYIKWSKKVFALFRAYLRLRTQQRLQFLLNWGNSLAIPST